MTMQPSFLPYGSHGLNRGNLTSVHLINTELSLLTWWPRCLQSPLCGVQIEIPNGKCPLSIVLILRGGKNDVDVIVLDLQSLNTVSVAQLMRAIFQEPNVTKVCFGLHLIMVALEHAIGQQDIVKFDKVVSVVDLKHAYATTPELHLKCSHRCCLQAVTLSAFVLEHLMIRLDMDAIDSVGQSSAHLDGRQIDALKDLGTCLLHLFDSYVKMSQLKQQQSLQVPVIPLSSSNLHRLPPPLATHIKPTGWGSQGMFLDGHEEELGVWPGKAPSLLSSKVRAVSMPATGPLQLADFDFTLPAFRAPAAAGERHPGPMSKPQPPNRAATLPRQALVPRQEEQGGQQANRGARRRGRRVCLDLSANSTSGPQEMDARRVTV